MTVLSIRDDARIAEPAERSLLGALLIDGSLVARLNGSGPEHFGAENHRAIFEAILALAGRGEGVDLVTVRSELEKTGRLERAGGAAVLSALVDRVPDVENVKSYERLVHEAFRHRQITAATNELVRAVNAGAPPEDLARLARAVEAIAAEVPTESEAPAQDGRRRVASFETLLAEPDEEIPWLIDHVLSARGLGVLAAESYMTKSTWAGCLSLHVAAGRDFLGWRIARPHPVLYWQTEGSVSRFKRRLAVAASYYGIDTGGLPLFLERSGTGEDFRSQNFRKVAERARGGLLVVDTAGSFYFGDENSAEEVRVGWIRPLKAVAAACDVAVLTIHHHGKPSKEREAHHRGRGSSALYGDLDSWLRMERVPGEPTHRMLYVDKVREAEPPAPLELAFLGDRAAFDVVAAEQGAVAGPKKEIREKETAAAKEESDRKAKEDVGLLFRRTPAGLTAEEIRTAFNRRREWVGSVLGELHAQGTIRRQKVERKNATGQSRSVDVWVWSEASPKTAARGDEGCPNV